MQAVASGARSIVHCSGGSGAMPPPQILRRPAALRCQQLRSSAGTFQGGRQRSHLQLQKQPSTRRRQCSVQPLAAADAAAGGDAAGGASSQPAFQPATSKRPRELSAKQRWRAFKFAILGALERLSQTEAFVRLARAKAALNDRLQPLYDFQQLVQRKYKAVLEIYNDFVMEETKREWRWANLHAKELHIWSQVPAFLGYFLATLVYEAFVPVTFLAAVALPLYHAWVLWDDWWRSPIFVALLVTAPMKWVPWAEMSLIWPGLI
ncbi:hypothetical protein D9Q98_004548 [Chlorella vulgaris]|uniref:Uncharacterized protein n=1 Tax=Chlorella vulgaris TaxID=3077 RepID=A0A9D4TQ30_CHLVU|nr:hypothetical protein D9Q98_004548 [Chlorella vulgaris]